MEVSVPVTSVWDGIVDRLTKGQVPRGGSRDAQVVLGVANIFFLGVGVMIAGAIDKNPSDVLIGLFQLMVPFFGWIWAIVWGVLMMLGHNNEHQDPAYPPILQSPQPETDPTPAPEQKV